MGLITGLRCVFCGKVYSTRVAYTCPQCGVTGVLDVEYDYRTIAHALTRRSLAARREFSHWRYRELLPIRADAKLPDVVVKAREKRKTIIACSSTGNAASSCAGMAASMGLRSVIFVPERAPEPKVTQLLIFGATVLRVLGSYEQAFQ